MKQVGSNWGMSGAIGWTESGSALIPVEVIGWSYDQKVAYRKSLGPSDTGSYIPLDKNDTIAWQGEIKTDKRPSTDWKGREVSIVLTQNTGKTITLTIQVQAWKVSTQKNANEAWPFAGSGVVKGEPTYSDGWAEQVAGASLTKADKDQYQGSNLVYDGDALGDTAQRTVYWWANLASDNFAGLSTKLVAVIGAHTAPTGMKYRPSSITQDVIDSGVIVLHYARTTTGEDVINAATGRTDDPSDLQDTETTAAFNGTPGAGTISGLVSRGITYKEYNDSNTLQVKHWGRRTTEQDITFPGTPVSIDKVTGTGGGGTGSTIALQSVKASTQVTANTTEPSWTPGGSPALKKRNWSFTQHTDAGKYVHRIEAGLTTVQEDQENQSSVINIDPSGLGTYEIHGRIVATSTTADPDVGTVTSGLTLYDRPTTEIHDNAYLRRFVYKPLNREEEIEHRSTSANASTPTPAVSTVLNVETLVDTCLDTDDVAELTATAWASHRNTAGFDGLAVSKLNKLRAQTRIRRVNDDKMVTISSPYSRAEQLGVLAGGTSGAVRISDYRESATGEHWVQIGAQRAYVSYHTVVLRRRKTSINNLHDVMSLAGHGVTNSDTFLGYTAEYLMFMGVIQRTNWTLEGVDHCQVYDLIFRYRSIKWFDDGVIRPYIGKWVLSDSSATPGSTLALNAIRNTWTADAPTPTAFAGFLS